MIQMITLNYIKDLQKKKDLNNPEKNKTSRGK